MAQPFSDLAAIQAEAQRIGTPWEQVRADYQAVTNQVNVQFPNLNLQCKAWLVDAHIWNFWFTTPYPGHKNCPLPTKLEDTYRALKEMRLRVDSLKNDKDKAVVLMNMKQSVITNQEEQIKFLQSQEKNLKELLKISETDLPNQKSLNEHLRFANGRLRMECDQKSAQITTLEERVQTLETEGGQKNTHIAILTEKYTNLKNDGCQKDMQIKTLEARITTLLTADEQQHSKIAEDAKKIERLELVVGQKQASIEVLQNRNFEYRAEITTKEKKINALSQQVNVLEHETGQKESDIADLKGRVFNLNGDIIIKNSKMNKLEVQFRDITELEAEVDERNDQITLLQGKITNLESDIAGKNGHISSLEYLVSQLELQTVEMPKLEEETSKKSAKIALFEDKIAKLESELREKTDRASTRKARITELESEFANKDAKNSKATSNPTFVEADAEELVRLRATVAQLKQDATRKNCELMRMSSEKKIAEHKAIKAQEDVKKVGAEVTELKSQLSLAQAGFIITESLPVAAPNPAQVTLGPVASARAPTGLRTPRPSPRAIVAPDRDLHTTDSAASILLALAPWRSGQATFPEEYTPNQSNANVKRRAESPELDQAPHDKRHKSD